MNGLRIFEEEDRLTLVLDGLSSEEKEGIKNMFSTNAMRTISSLLPAQSPEMQPPETRPVVDTEAEAAIKAAKDLLADNNRMREIGVDETVRILARADRNPKTIEWLRKWDPSKDSQEKKVGYYKKLKAFVAEL